MPGLDVEALTATLIETVPDPVYVVDLDGRLVWWNDRLETVTGYDGEELAGMDAFELLAPEHREPVRAALERVDSFAPAETLEFDLRTRDGQCVPHEFNGSVLTVEDRRVVAVVARDVTDRRDRESAIRRQREELETLNRISEAVHESIRAVVEAASREEVEQAVCERLAASDLYRAVWIARVDGDGTVEARTGVGADDGFLEAVAAVDDIEWTRPAQVAAETGEVQFVQRIPEDDVPGAVKDLAAERGIAAGASVPVVTRDTVAGVLTVYSSRPDAFNERERAAFRRLGEVVGFAIGAVRAERLVLSDTATELTFRVSGADALLAPVSRLADGPCRHEWSAPAGDGTYRHYVSVVGIDPETVVDRWSGRPTVERVEHVGEDGGADVFEVVSSDSLVQRFLGAGAAPVSIVAEDGTTTVVAELPGEADVRPVVESAEELYDAELVSKRAVDRPVRTADGFRDAVAGSLTDRQEDALRHALFGGYFSWPRESTAEEVADAMRITSPTFHYHVRRAQRALVEAYFEHLDS